MRDVQHLIPQGPHGLDSRGFSADGEAGAPGCCLWCGRKLGAAKIISIAGAENIKPEFREARGDYGDNAFCGLRCGYRFGVQMAIFGRRLQVKKEG